MAQGFFIEKSSIKIVPEFVRAPEGGLRTYVRPKRSTDDVRWLQFFISYVPYSAGGTVVWEDDLTVELMVLLPAKKGQGYGNVLFLKGKEVFYSVPGDKKNHYILFQIPPATLTKYTSIAKYDNRFIERNVFAAVIFRRGSNNQVLATGYAAMKNRTTSEIAQLFDQYHKSKIGVMRLENGILPKAKTPWQWIDVDIFDSPKSMIEGNK